MVKRTTLRDRTTEFRQLAVALKKRQSEQVDRRIRQHNDGAQYGEFSRQAGSIGKDIQDTAAALEQLAKLARSKTLFDDKTSEINSLTQSVKQRIATINGKILSLQALQQQQRQNGGNGRQASEHQSNIVVSLQSQLANTSTVFKDVLELRSESLKATGSRKEQFIGSAATGNLDYAPAGVRNRRKNEPVDSPLYQSERRIPENSNGSSYNNGSDDFVALSMPDIDASSQMLLMQEQQSSYLDTRSDAIRSIESTISDLGQIFQQLAHMVSEQREVVQRIDANIESVDMNISGAQTELLRYYNNISSNRWLMFKIFLVILVFSFLLVMFV